ncbi:MAG: hypothetical protein JO099_09015 [Acidobacteriia bacterium]|nr:hypothetical protein [Terriglobia bacterium]
MRSTPPPNTQTTLRTNSVTPQPAPNGAPVTTPPDWVRIQYLEVSPVRVMGPFTGRSYEFSGSQRIQTVDTRDAQSLLRTRFFRRAS